MTFEEKFDKLSKKLIKADTSKFKANFALQITMNDEDCGGTFFAAYFDGVYRVEPYNYFDNTANINVLAETLEKLVDKKITVQQAFDRGILFADGNTEHIANFFDSFEKKKTAAKKTTTAKKASAKKSESTKKTESAKKAKPAKSDAKAPASKSTEKLSQSKKK